MDHGLAGLGVMEVVGASSDELRFVIQSFGESVRLSTRDVGQDAGLVLLDGPGALDERLEARATGPGDPPFEYLGGTSELEVVERPGEHFLEQAGRYKSRL